MLLYIVITLGLLQFIKIEIPALPTASPAAEIVAPKEVTDLLKRSCYVCHSDSTKVPWYGNIAPISFSVRGHVKDGRAWLNYQRWSSYTKAEQKERLEQMAHSLKTLQMPIPIYLWAHKEARLNKLERDLLIDWAEKKLRVTGSK